MKHWWLKEGRKFTRVRMNTLYRLGALYQAEQAEKGEMSGEVPLFLIWLEKYIELGED